MGSDWTEALETLTKILPKSGEGGEVAYRDKHDSAWKLSMLNEDVAFSGSLIRMVFTQVPVDGRQSNVAFYELFWPESASLPIIQHAAQGLMPTSEGEKGVWIARTESQASRDFELDGVSFSENCLGVLSPVQAEEQFLTGLRYVGNQLECRPTTAFSLDIV